jgi:hypothetical protein
LKFNFSIVHQHNQKDIACLLSRERTSWRENEREREKKYGRHFILSRISQELEITNSKIWMICKVTLKWKHSINLHEEFSIANHSLFHFIKRFSHLKTYPCRVIHSLLPHAGIYITTIYIAHTHKGECTESIFSFSSLLRSFRILLYLFMSILLTNRPPKKKEKRSEREGMNKTLITSQVLWTSKAKIIHIKAQKCLVLIPSLTHSLFWC